MKKLLKKWKKLWRTGKTSRVEMKNRQKNQLQFLADAFIGKCYIFRKMIYEYNGK